MNSQFQFTVSRFTFQMQTPDSEVLLQLPWECFVQTKGKPRQIPRAGSPMPVLIALRFPFSQLRCIQCNAEFFILNLSTLFLFPNSSLSPSFNQQLCFDFHLRLFVAHCTFGSFQWHFNVPTRTAAAPFYQGLLTAVLASSLFHPLPHRILSGFSPILHLLQADIVKIHNWTALLHSLSLPLFVDVCVCMLCVCLFVCVCLPSAFPVRNC